MRRFFIPLAILTSACGCGGGSSGGSPPAFVATPAPTPSPTPPPGGPLNATPSTVAFTAQGQTTSVTVSEAGYAGSVAADGIACATIASVSPGAQTAPATFVVTAQGAGTCTLGFTDRFGQRAQTAVGVTITRETIQ